MYLAVIPKDAQVFSLAALADSVDLVPDVFGAYVRLISTSDDVFLNSYQEFLSDHSEQKDYFRPLLYNAANRLMIANENGLDMGEYVIAHKYISSFE